MHVPHTHSTDFKGKLPCMFYQKQKKQKTQDQDISTAWHALTGSRPPSRWSFEAVGMIWVLNVSSLDVSDDWLMNQSVILLWGMNVSDILSPVYTQAVDFMAESEFGPQ